MKFYSTKLFRQLSTKFKLKCYTVIKLLIGESFIVQFAFTVAIWRQLSNFSLVLLFRELAVSLEVEKANGQLLMQSDTVSSRMCACDMYIHVLRSHVHGLIPSGFPGFFSLLAGFLMFMG